MICKHFPQCGGCQLQNLSEAEERAQKEENFLKTLRTQGIETHIDNFESSPLHSRRRAGLSGKRTKKSSLIGFFEPRSHQIVDMDMCLILEPEIFALIPALKSMMPIIASRSSIVKLHITHLAHGFDLEIENAKAITPEALQSLAQICLDAQIHRLRINNEAIFQDAPAQIQIGENLITIPPHPFLQATKHGENTLRHLAHTAIKDAKKVADLFAGIGTFSYDLPMNVTAFEGNAKMSEAMQENLNQQGAHHIKAQSRDLFREPLTPSELEDFDAVIIDPPRAGAKAQVAELAQSNIPRIAYISCDQASFAREARTLIDGGYKMQPITLIDQFRFSNHIESFTVFDKL